MTTITNIPAGTSHILTNREHEGDAEFIQKNGDHFREWFEGVTPVFSKWVYIPACLIDLKCYTPISEVNNV